MSNASWTGISLREVLDFCGLNRSYIDKNGLEHVVFKGADGVTASIPMQKATCPGDCVLLAYEMNGQPLPRDHGYPLRVIVPGHVGIRNIKWVETIQCSKSEAEGPWQRGLAYKGFNPSTTSTEGINIEKLTSLQEMPVQSAIVKPLEGQDVEVRDGRFKVNGYAWSGGGRGIIRVDVSADMGHTWHVANLREGHDQPLDKAWAWTLWDVDVPVPTAGSGARVEIRCRATDASFNVQPDSSKSVWNLRGIANNAVHRVTAKTVTVKD
jgi:sulfite oxidase